MTAKIALPRARYDTDQKREAFFRELMPRVRQLPGVGNAAVAMLLPTTAWIRTNVTDIEGKRGAGSRRRGFLRGGAEHDAQLFPDAGHSDEARAQDLRRAIIRPVRRR